MQSRSCTRRKSEREGGILNGECALYIRNAARVSVVVEAARVIKQKV
jgi:hypothetical protein